MDVVFGMHINKNGDWVLIPARNEEASLGEVIQNIKLVTEAAIVVVDSMSTDDTAQVAKKMGVCVVSATQAGYLYALQTGYRFLLQQTNCHTVVQVDADGQHNPLHIPRLNVHIQPNNPAPQWIVGSRSNTGTRADRTLNLAGELLRWYVQRISHYAYDDISSGFWCLNRAAMELFLHFTPPNQSADVAIRLFAARYGVYPIEIPTEMGPRLSGQSMHHGVQRRLTHLSNLLQDVRWVNHMHLDR